MDIRAWRIAEGMRQATGDHAQEHPGPSPVPLIGFDSMVNTPDRGWAACAIIGRNDGAGAVNIRFRDAPGRTAWVMEGLALPLEQLSLGKRDPPARERAAGRPAL